MNVLEIKDLTKKFQDFVAIDKMNLTVKEGEIFGFLGANGAGKSTTIHILAGLLRKTSGEIFVLGKSMEKHKKYIKSNIGIVPQDLAIYEDLSAYENVKFFAGLYGLRGSTLENAVDKALTFVGLIEHKKSLPKSFSGGMKRRLNIACAIAHQPKLIIMDEPTVGIDPQSRNYILQSVKKLNEMGSTIIYTSHYMEEVEEICTRIAIVDHGQIIAEGSKEQLKSIITNTKKTVVKVDFVKKLALDDLKKTKGVSRISVNENDLTIYSDVGTNQLTSIIQTLLQHQVSILSVEEKTPNLETVFLTLTGRSLRDS